MQQSLERPFTSVIRQFFARSSAEPSNAIESLRMLVLVLASIESVQVLCFVFAHTFDFQLPLPTIARPPRIHIASK